MAGDRRSATIEDVAAHAGVSVATVSRALRDLPNVAPSTRERVQAVASELAYVSNPSAARLAQGRTGTVAVLVPAFETWYFSRVVAGLESVLAAEHVDLLLYAVRNEADRSAFFAGRGAWWRRSDALVMVDITLTEAESGRLASQGAKIVTIGRRIEPFASVTLDEAAAAALVADQLVAAGHTAIAALTGDPGVGRFEVPIHRLAGFADRLDGLGHPLRPEWAISGAFTIDGGRDATRQLLDLDQRPTAVFAMSDEMALGALDELSSRGLQAPDDLAVVGFDDIEVAALFGLTTVRQDVVEIGATAGRLVLDAMNDADPIDVVAPTELVVRRTA